MSTDTLLTFPCDFTIKLIGLAGGVFEAEALSIVRQHDHTLTDDRIQSKLSDNGKYQSLSVTVYVESKEQLDQLYRELSSSPTVLMAL